MLVRLCRGRTANDQRLRQAKRNQERIRAQEGVRLVCEERRRLLCTSRRPRPPLSVTWREAGREREHTPELADFPSGCGVAQAESARSCPPRRPQRARAARASPALPQRSCGPAPPAAQLLRRPSSSGGLASALSAQPGPATRSPAGGREGGAAQVRSREHLQVLPCPRDS